MPEKDKIQKPASARVAYLFVESPEKFPKAKAMLKEWRKQSDFDKHFEGYAMKARNLGSGALTGGVIERFTAGKYNPLLDEKVFSVEVGKPCEPFSTPKGMFIIKVLERDAGEPLPPDQAKVKLYNLIMPEKPICPVSGSAI